MVGSNSEIALVWTMYEKSNLHVYQQNRVINIRCQVELDKLFWKQGTEMPMDAGTRPDLVTLEMVKPGSLYLSGVPWMR